jgi:hypothetical protein
MAPYLRRLRGAKDNGRVSNAERVMEIIAPLFSGDEAWVDDAMIDRFAASVAAHAEPDFTTRMVSIAGRAQTFTGADGMRAGLKDWSETFAELHFEAEDLQVYGENVLTVARQVGVTRHDRVRIEQPSGIVWKFRDGVVQGIEWHLDRKAAEASARGD